MIFDKIEYCAQYKGLSENFQKAFDYIESAKLLDMPVGRYAIDGDDVYVMIQHYELKAWEDGVWEAHKNYADIQIPLDTDELLGFRALAGGVVTGEYNPVKDVLFIDPSSDGTAVRVAPGDFMVFFPSDAHRPCIRRPEAASGTLSRRAVVKVRVTAE